MKCTLSFFTLVLLLTACRRQESQLSPDDEIRKKLPGIWVFEAKYASGGDHQCTLTLARDGSCLARIDIPGRTNGPQIISMEGTFRVEDGFLIDVVTKDSQTNAPMPSTNRSRIVRIDDRELVLDYEKNSWSVYPTNQVVFQKQTK